MLSTEQSSILKQLIVCGIMGIKQRREREKQEVRQGILTAAREIAQHEGWQAVTIRKVAERIEYSPSMIYEYFASKEAMLLELHLEGLRLLTLSLKTARGSTEDYEERVISMAEAYWEFAQRHPELYQVMHGLNGVPLDCSEEAAIVHEAFDTTVEALNEWAQSRGIELPDVKDAVEIFRAFLHGLVCLKMEHRMRGDEARVRRLVRRGIHDLLTSWSLSTKD
ncbi:MAG TPA: TetR/AcrR family transcriptional regulator [Ktedonobacteraceae bacterium]|nr:TetR/AcrR family transcriptional regulator [Ktedonobacteraceae bacterium]